MKNAWTDEYTRIIILAAFGLFIGGTTGYWVLAVLIPSVLYIGWTLIQIRAFERWIRQGIKTDMAPNANGIWELIVQHLYRSQKRDVMQKERLTDLLHRFESTISALPYATVTLNERLEVVWANSAAEQTLGIAKFRDEGMRIDNIIRKPEMQKVLHCTDATQTVQMTSPVDPNMILTLTCVTYEGDQKLLAAKDISQILEVQKLRKAFISNASHELRTPLTVISGYLEMIASDPQLPDGLDVLVDNAHVQSVRMVSILDDLLTLSKLVEKESFYHKDSGETVDVSQIIDKLITDMGKTAPEYTLDNEVGGGLQIRGNEPELFSLCQNLLSNAIKYSPPGAEIRVGWTNQPDGWLGIQFIDNGEGIAPDHISRLTERFYRVNNKRDREVSGTGLGLSIVKHILENHGGYLEIESEPGFGSTFTAYFPEYRVISVAQAEAV